MVSPADSFVRDLRHTSRQLVRALGFMQGRMGDSGCTAAQCHALIELGAAGRLTTGELAQRLEVDKSTASRTVRPLLERELVRAETDPGDQRARPLRLTGAGQRLLEGLHAAADAQVSGALALLGEEERAAVLRGVSLYERALHRAKVLAEVVMRPIEPRDDPAMAAIIRGVMTEFGAVGCGFSINDPEVDGMSAAYAGPRQAYWVVEKSGALVAGAGIASLVGSDRDDVCARCTPCPRPVASAWGVCSWNVA
jgi:putative acetyltransferase